MFLIMIKMLSFLRAFKEIAFLMKMIFEVVMNLKYFFIVTFWTLFAFGTLGLILYCLFIYFNLYIN